VNELGAQPITLGLSVLIDKTEIAQRRQMPVHLRLRFAELIGERGQPHRLPCRGERLDDLPRHHHRLDHAGAVDALLVIAGSGFGVAHGSS
jgi:hypothetical protein